MNPISLQTALPSPTVHETPKSAPGASTETDFSLMLEQTIGSVNQLQNEADAAIGDLTTGSRNDIHQTMIAVEKASIAFELMMQVRNKIITAYETVMRMSV